MFKLMLVYQYAVVPAVNSATKSVTAVVRPVITTTCAAASTTTEAISTVARPVLTTAYTAGSTVVSWVQPLPVLDNITKWKYGPPLAKWKYSALQFIIHNESSQLFNLFKDPAQLNQLNEQHILCALHHPGLALDLFVVHDKKTIHDYWLKNHYADWTGTGRDRLFINICNMMSEDPDLYEPLLRGALEDRESLLFEVLHDHRYSLSFPALGGTRPSTLMQVNSLLHELEQNRILAGLPPTTTNNNRKK